MRVVPFKSDRLGLHVYQVTVEIAIPYLLPDGVDESAVIRATRLAKSISVVDLEEVR